MEITANIQRIIIKLFIAFLACTVLLWFSLFAYGLLYYLYIPAIAHVKPVHLLFDTVCSKDQRCKNPYANVSLAQKNSYELLTRGQAYAVELVLDMPESERNLEQGMFMVRLDMLSDSGHILQSSRRPGLLRYRSLLFKIAYTLFFMPALLAGSVEEKQTLTIPMFEQFIEYNPIYFIYVEIEAQRFEVYSSTIKIHAQFTGLRYMMYYWPVFSLIVGVGSNFFFVVVIAIFIWIRQEMNASQEPEIQRIHERERDSVEEIRKAVRQKKLEAEGGTGIQRRAADIETLSSHEGEATASQESAEVDTPSERGRSSLSDIIGLRRRVTEPSN